MDRIPVFAPWITDKEVDYVTDAARNAWSENAGTYNRRFEEAFAAYVGTKHAISLPSCTSAFHLSLLAFGIGQGDEVVVPDLTWIATAAPVTYVGATPVFADVDPNTWCMTGQTFEAVITDRTKAVIPVDLYGNMAQMDEIRRIAESRGIAVIEDAAEAVGSAYKGKRAGAWGDTAGFSFFGAKTSTTGEGGMLVTDRDDIHEQCLILRDHGRRPQDPAYFNHQIGWKYKMSAFQAAMGLAQTERMDELIAKRRDIYQWYRNELDGVDGFVMNHEDQDTYSTFWMITVVLDESLGMGKVALGDKFSEAGIDTRPIFYPLSAIPAFSAFEQAKIAAKRNPVAYRLGLHGVNLPSGYNLTSELVRRVCDTFKTILSEIN